MTRKYCHSNKDVPKTKHYAIITFGTYTVPGDERSRTNPGHGYPEHTEHTADYVAYEDRAEWEKEVSRLTLDTGFGRRDFVALIVEPVSVKTHVSVEVGNEG